MALPCSEGSCRGRAAYSTMHVVSVLVEHFLGPEQPPAIRAHCLDFIVFDVRH